MRHWLILGLLAATPALGKTAAPGAEAEALGKRIAQHGTFATLLPLVTARDTEALIAEHPELDDAGKARLRAAAAVTARAASERLVGTIGHQYAIRLGLDDLKTFAAFYDTPAARHWRAAEPAVIGATVGALDGFDFKQAAWTAYCQTPDAKCARSK